MSKMAVIAGTGAGRLFQDMVKKHNSETPYGTVTIFSSDELDPSVPVVLRHGAGRRIPPHLVNYRANVDALARMGVERILALGAVGSLRSSLRPGDVVFPDQFLDFTKARHYTFADQASQRTGHADFANPFCEDLRKTGLSSASELEMPVHPRAVYVCTEGPRYETAAEIRMFKMLGGDIVGMTCIPECILAGERGICYFHISVVTNMAAGMQSETITHEKVERTVAGKSVQLRNLVKQVVENERQAGRKCRCAARAT